MLTFLVGLFVGGSVGILVAGLLVSSRLDESRKYRKDV